jgi:hypothetical protein
MIHPFEKSEGCFFWQLKIFWLDHDMLDSVIIMKRIRISGPKRITLLMIAVWLCLITLNRFGLRLVEARNLVNAENQETHQVFIPLLIGSSPKQGKFSVAGATNETAVLQVVPTGHQIDPYIWDVLPNTNSSIQMLRVCTYYRPIQILYNPTRPIFLGWYQANKIGHLCWDPLNEQIAQIINLPGCPYYGETPTKACLDTEVDTIVNTGETELRSLVQNNPDWVWLIGNEPDNIWQDALIDEIDISNGVITTTVQLSGTLGYATFFKEIYEIIADEISSSPKLVFCQSTIAWNDPNRPNFGLDYCENAFDQLQILGFGSEQIYALATHQYMYTTETYGGNPYFGGELLDGTTQPIIEDSRSVLVMTIEKFETYLQEFEDWAESENMGTKPLWLTEYGSLWAWCYEVQGALRPEIDEVGGVACPNTGQDYVFYGRNSNEGLWGLQTGQIEYLLHPGNNWESAWWFVSKMGDWNGDGYCDMTAWLWKADFNCRVNSGRPDNLSRAGETQRLVLECIIQNTNCPVVIPHPSPDF